MIEPNTTLSINVDEINLRNQDSSLLKGFSIDGPSVGTVASALDFSLCGWIVGSGERPLLSLEINVDGFQLKRIPVNLPRKDVTDYLGLPEQQMHCGFDTRVGLLGLPKSANIEVVAVFRGDSPNQRVKVHVATIRASKSSNLSKETKFQPLILTAIGRSGTTWLMKLLSQHPEIVTSNFYPYEVKQSAYWMQLLKIMTDPADFAFSSHPDKFDVTMGSIGHNPYNYPHYLNSYNDGDAIKGFYSSAFIEQSRDFSLQQIDTFYDMLAKDENKPSARYYSEKFVPTHLQSIYQDVYQNPKEIILVRDFRDVLCSAKSFNEKRNSVAFGRERVNDDFEWVEHVSKAGIKRMANAWSERKDTAFLLKYEDLIIEPEKTLSALFDYLDVDAGAEFVQSLIDSASESNASMDAHKTTKNPKESVGRWRRDMAPELQQLCVQEMGDMLSIFGYDLK